MILIRKLAIGFFLVAAFVFGSSDAHAAYTKGNHVVSFSLGGVIGADNLGEVKGAGLGTGLAYRYYLADQFSLGGDVAYDDYGDHYSDDDKTDIGTTILNTALLGRIDFWPRNPIATYFSLGVGSAYIERTFHETPERTENTGRASVFLALGFEMPLKGKWMWGGELRSTDPLGVSVNALGLKFSLSRRFGPEAVPIEDSIK